MSELNSPFLDNKEEENNINNNQVSSEDNNLHTMDYQPESIVDNQHSSENDNEGEIEIKDEGKLLKNIIIILIIFLILSILGLVLYNFIFGKKKEADKANQQSIQQVEQNANSNTFEMNGKDFNAGSIVIE